MDNKLIQQLEESLFREIDANRELFNCKKISKRLFKEILDVLIDKGERSYRIQVKTCTKKSTYGKNKDVYRFSLRSAKGANRAIKADKVDCIAFVFTNKKTVQYIGCHLLTSEDGYLKQCIDFKEEGKTKYVIGKFSNF